MASHPRFSLHLIRGFWVAARHLSFTRAAEELFVTQSAISREVKKLEEQLGQALFQRVNRALNLTRAGEELFQGVDEAFALIDEAARRVADAHQTLAITTTIPLASLWLVPRLPRFTRAHPDIDLRILASNDVVDLTQAQVDVAIRYVRRSDRRPDGDFLADYRTFPVCAPALLQDATKHLNSVADLAHHVLLEFETTVHGRPWYDWDQWFKAMKIDKIDPAGRQRFTHYDHVVEATRAGSGIAIGKWPHLIARLQDGSLSAPFGPEAISSLGAFHLVVADGAIGRAAVDAFIDWVRAEFRDGRQVTGELPG